MTKKTISTKTHDQCFDPTRSSEEVPIDSITIDLKYQVRVEGLNEETVKEYEQIYAESPGRMPPITLVRINGELHLVAGFQRIEAAKQAKRKSIRAIVIDDGDEKIAMKEAIGSNKHGLKLSNEDKKKAIQMALETFPDFSNVRIAELVGCSESYVRKIKEKENPSGSRSANPNSKVTGKDGKTQASRKTPRKASTAENERTNDETEDVVEGHDEATEVTNTQETQVDNGGEDAEGGDQGTVSDLERVKATPTTNTEEVPLAVAETTPSPAVTDIVTEKLLSEYHIKFFSETPEDDEKRLNFSELIVRHVLLGKFSNEQCRPDLFQRIEALLQKFGPK